MMNYRAWKSMFQINKVPEGWLLVHLCCQQWHGKLLLYTANEEGSSTFAFLCSSDGTRSGIWGLKTTQNTVNPTARTHPPGNWLMPFSIWMRGWKKKKGVRIIYLHPWNFPIRFRNIHIWLKMKWYNNKSWYVRQRFWDLYLGGLEDWALGVWERREEPLFLSYICKNAWSG